MSGRTRPARTDELARLWPIIRSAHLVPDAEALGAMHANGPWQIRVSDEGDVLVMGRWRAHLDVVAMRGVWAPPHRVGDLVSDACAVARSLGLGRVISPLVEQRESTAYRDAGMTDLERLVACTASVAAVCGLLEDRVADVPGARVRAATRGDVDALVALDETCFDEFWRHGEVEVLEAIESGHVVVASEAGDPLADPSGYAVSLLSGSTVSLGRLAVASSARRAGVGTALLSEAAVWARAMAARGLSLCTQADNAAARALYRSAGFAEMPQDYRLLIVAA